mgnify:CR=1 FL=1
MESAKRKALNEAQECPTKRTRVDEGLSNFEENSPINDLPSELLAVILEFAGEPAPRVMWVVGRSVCELWKNLLPSCTEAQMQIISKEKRRKRLPSQMAENGWIVLLLWASEQFPWGCGRIFAPAAKYGHLSFLKQFRKDARLVDYLDKIQIGAAKGGQLGVLKWITELGNLSIVVGSKAVIRGRVEVEINLKLMDPTTFVLAF